MNTYFEVLKNIKSQNRNNAIFVESVMALLFTAWCLLYSTIQYDSVYLMCNKKPTSFVWPTVICVPRSSM